MGHPYRSAPSPDTEAGRPGREDCPDADIAAVLLLTAAAAASHLAWAYRTDSFSGETELAAVTVVVSLVLLRPVVAWALRRLRDVKIPSRRQGGHCRGRRSRVRR